MRTTPAARLRASDRGNTPSPFKIAHTAAYSIHSFTEYPGPRVFPAGRQYARGPSLEDSGSMLDSVFRDRNYPCNCRQPTRQRRCPNRLGHPHSCDAPRLLLQPSWRHRLRWAGRAALRVDRARHGGDWRLGHAASVWKAVVREAAAVLLGGCALLQALGRQRSRRAFAQRHFRAVRHACISMAGLASLRRRNGSLADSSAPYHRRHDWVLSRRRHGYAFQRDAHNSHGLRRRRFGAYAQRKYSDPSANSLARAHLIRFLPRSCRTRQRTRRHHSLRRRCFFLGALHQTLARRLPPPSPLRNRVLLPHRASLVHPLRPPQPRLLPNLHRRAQFQALPHPRISAHPAVLVLPPRSSGRFPSLDCTFPLVRIRGHSKTMAHSKYLSFHLAVPLLGRLLPDIFFHIEIETSWLHPPFYSSALPNRDACVRHADVYPPKIISVQPHHGGRLPVSFARPRQNGYTAHSFWERAIRSHSWLDHCPNGGGQYFLGYLLSIVVCDRSSQAPRRIRGRADSFSPFPDRCFVVILLSLGSVRPGTFRGNSAQRNSCARVAGENHESRPALQSKLLPSQRGHRVGGGASP